MCTSRLALTTQGCWYFLEKFRIHIIPDQIKALAVGLWEGTFSWCRDPLGDLALIDKSDGNLPQLIDRASKCCQVFLPNYSKVFINKALLIFSTLSFYYTKLQEGCWRFLVNAYFAKKLKKILLYCSCVQFLP